MLDGFAAVVICSHFSIFETLETTHLDCQVVSYEL